MGDNKLTSNEELKEQVEMSIPKTCPCCGRNDGGHNPDCECYAGQS